MIDILPTVKLFVFQLFMASSVVKLSRELAFIILYKLILFMLLVFGSYCFFLVRKMSRFHYPPGSDNGGSIGFWCIFCLDS